MPHQGPRAPTTELTAGERTVLNLLLARPLESNKELALALGCSVKNVEFHMSNILRKTGAASRMELLIRMLGGKPGEDGAGNGQT